MVKLLIYYNYIIINDINSNLLNINILLYVNTQRLINKKV